jgi:hypothetical protein
MDKIIFFVAVSMLLCGCINENSTDLDVENAKTFCNTCIPEVDNTRYMCTITFRVAGAIQMYEGYCSEVSECQTMIHNSPYVCGLNEPKAFKVFGETRIEALELISNECNKRQTPYTLKAN